VDTATGGPAVKPVNQSLPGTVLNTKPDTSSAVHADSTVVDTVRSRSLRGMGQFTEEVDTLSALSQRQFLWSDAKVPGDLIWKLPGFFYRDLGEAGKWGQLIAFGADARSIGIFMDGRPMNDPVTGTYNLSDLPLEAIDHTDILTGPSSLSASGGDGILLNFVSRSFNSYRPMTKIRFVQDPLGTILTDGLFTQNVARGLNLTIGFQRTVTQGRYANASLDAWNVRTRLRYNVSDRLNLQLSDFYTKAGNGLNGGIDPLRSASLFDPASAVEDNPSSHDNRSRRDVTFSVIGRFFADSSSTTHASFYYSTLEREYWNLLQTIDDSTHASFWGVRLRQEFSVDPLRVKIGGTIERRQCELTRTLPSKIETEHSLFAQAEFHMGKLFVPSVAGGITSINGENSTRSGIGVQSTITDWLTLMADASWYDRFPTLQERYWRDTIVVREKEIRREQHAMIQGGIKLSAGPNLQLELSGFQRTIDQAIVFQPLVLQSGSSGFSISNINRMKVLGLNGRIDFFWSHIEAFGVMTLQRTTQDGLLTTLMPDLILSGELCYRDLFFKEKLEAKFGARSRFLNRQQGMQFDPQSLSYFQSHSDLLLRSTTFDLFMILKIGDAHISLSWNNILNAGYLVSPVYPMPGRNIRLGVNWVFMD